MNALFERDGDRFFPTELTRGGWSDDHQHGSPPAGLLAWAIERIPTASPMRTVRLTIDLFRAVPLTELRLESDVVRDGRRIQSAESRLYSGDVLSGRATAVRIRLHDPGLPVFPPREPDMPGSPEDGEPPVGNPHGPDTGLVRFHLDGVDIRSFNQSFGRPGHGAAWFRLRQSLFADEPDSPFVRLATLADLSNGNGTMLTHATWSYVNPDITIYAPRDMVGEWIGMRSSSAVSPDGIGHVTTVIHDAAGPFGTINQSQVIDRF